MQQLTRGIHVKLGLFVALALVGTSYLGATYVGFTPFSQGYQVTVTLPEAGGLFVNSEVTYRGVQVGEVTAMEPVGDSVEVTVEIEPDAPDIPSDAEVAVHNRSTIGEQYLDLQGGDTDEVLADGDHLDGGGEAVPQDLSEVLSTARDFTASVPSDALNTVIDESYDFSQGAGDDVARLVRTSIDFQRAADANFLVSASLIRNSEHVLATQEESGAAIVAYSNDLSLFADTLADSDADLRTLIESTPGATDAISTLISDVGIPLGTLMSNLVSTATIFGVNSRGVEDTMIHLPEAVSVGWSINTANGLNMGLVPTFFDPLPCVEGYGGTDNRPGTETGPGRPLNKQAGCAAPRSKGNVRGSQAVPGAATDRPATGPAATADITVVEDLGALMGGSE
jgi:phospholipid/cholesterol/gamma-HCH transport system substrate-binding protein